MHGIYFPRPIIFIQSRSKKCFVRNALRKTTEEITSSKYNNSAKGITAIR